MTYQYMYMYTCKAIASGAQIFQEYAEVVESMLRRVTELESNFNQCKATNENVLGQVTTFESRLSELEQVNCACLRVRIINVSDYMYMYIAG